MVSAYIQDSYKLVFPILCEGYLRLDYDPTNIDGSSYHPSVSDRAPVSTGVLVNGAVSDNSATNIAVDTVDATLHFSVGDTVYDSSNASVGTVSAVTATQITLAANNDEALDNDENLKKDMVSNFDLRDRSIWSGSNTFDTEEGITGGFVLEAIITPYDVNGIASRTAGRHGVLDSQKTPPYPNDNSSDVADRTAYESVDYLGASAYLSQQMTLFHNTNLQFYLENTTTTSGSSYNQPAEYKLVAKLTTGGTTETIETDAIITASSDLHGFYNANGYYNDITTSYRRVTASATGSNPSNVVTITSFANLERNTKATGQIVVSGDIANYTKPVKATGSITIVQRNNLNTDTFVVAEQGQVLFGPTNPTDANTSNVNNYIQIVDEGGSTTTKWYAMTTGANGDTLTGTSGAGFTWPSGARLYLIGDDFTATASNFAAAVNAYGVGFGGTASDPRSTVNTSNQSVAGVTLTVATTGSAPNRVGITSASITAGSGISAGQLKADDFGSSNALAANLNAGVNELILGESTGSNDNTINYFTITDSAGNTKNYFPSHDLTNQDTGDTGTRTFDDGSTKSVVYFRFGATAGNNAAATALANAINDTTVGHGNTITAVASGTTVNLTHDLIGAAGNNATIAKANIANSAATISGSNFTGGVTETNASNTPFIQLIDNAGSPVTKKYVPVANGGAIATGGLNGGSIGDVSGGVAFQEGGSASATADNLRTAIAHSNGHAGSILTDSAGSATINLTQNTVGANTAAITLTNLPSNISKTNFSGGGTPNNSLNLTDAAGTLKKYKASEHEATGTTDGTFVFYKAETNNDTTAANLETAIDGANGHNGTLITSRSSNAVTVKLNQAGTGSSAVVETVNGLNTNPASGGGFSAATANTIEVSSSSELTEIGKGNKIYDSSTTEIGTVDGVSSSTITLTGTPATAITSTIYTDQLKEALYLEQVYKVSLVYGKNGNLELYLNNALVKKQKHTIAPFALHNSDCRIGRGPTDGSAGNNTQFFGELFEIAMHKSNRPCTTIETLTPGFSDILFYYTFGD